MPIIFDWNFDTLFCNYIVLSDINKDNFWILFLCLSIFYAFACDKHFFLFKWTFFSVSFSFFSSFYMHSDAPMFDNKNWIKKKPKILFPMYFGFIPPKLQSFAPHEHPLQTHTNTHTHTLVQHGTFTNKLCVHIFFPAVIRLIFCCWGECEKSLQYGWINGFGIGGVNTKKKNQQREMRTN